MADYNPRFAPGEAFTLAASGTITGGNVVAVSGSGTVAAAGANADNWVGVAAFDAVSGDKLTIRTGGVQRLVASGTVTAGDQVVCAASGRVATLAAAAGATAGDINAARRVVGLALTTAADGAVVDVQMER